MKRLALGTLAAVMLNLGAAGAADLRAPAMVVEQGFNWTGLYSGFYAGYGSGDLRASIDGVNISPLPKPEGFFSGTNIGYNWQTSNIVFGVEADFSYGRIRGSNTILSGPGLTVGATSNLDYFVTFRGRLGVAHGGLLAYVTGGGVWGHNNGTVDVNQLGIGTRLFDERHHWGWTAGGGLEWAFNDRWSAKIEYLYLDFDRQDYRFVTGPGVPATSVDLSVHTVKIGLNYRTDWLNGFAGSY